MEAVETAAAGAAGAAAAEAAAAGAETAGTAVVVVRSAQSGNPFDGTAVVEPLVIELRSAAQDWRRTALQPAPLRLVSVADAALG